MYRLDLGDLYRGRLSPWRAARLASQLGVGARVNTGVSDETWAMREVYSATVGEPHPAIKAEIDRQRAAEEQREQVDEKTRLARIKARQEQHALRRAEALASRAAQEGATT